MEKEIYDLAIIGGGPAGATAGVYAARKKLKSIMIVGEWGGQSVVSDDLQNWIGIPHISGADMAKRLEEHVREYAEDVVTIDAPTKATHISKNDEGLFTVTTENDRTYVARTVLVTVGSTRRKLAVPGAEEFDHKGLTYCATCDGPMFSGRDVAVIGGGNAGFESAAQLLAYTQSVTLLEYGEHFAADAVTVEKLLQHKNFTAIKNAQTVEVIGDTFVTGLVYKDRTTDEEKTLAVTGVFVEIGMIPNTDLVKDIVTLDAYNRIPVDPYTQKTQTDGLWAAGDCTDVLYHQNGIAMGDATKAIEDIYGYLRA